MGKNKFNPRSGGNSHQRETQRKAAEIAAKDDIDGGENTPTTKGHLPDNASVIGTQAPNQQAVVWLWKRLWGWPVVALIVSSNIALAYLVAQEHIYLLSRIVIGFDIAVVFSKSLHDITESGLPRDAKRTGVLFLAVLLLLLGVGCLWLVHTMEQRYLSELPRAYLHVDDVTVELTSDGLQGATIPLVVVAHIDGYNVSTSVATRSTPIVQASLSFRSCITPQRVSDEADLFTHGKWAGATYAGFQHALNPLERFSFSKSESLLGNDADPFSFDKWKKIKSGEFCIYVVTRAIYADRWGPTS